MHSQMHSETLQALRAEIEAVATLQLALNRIALSVEPDSLSVWEGPRPEDVDDVAADDGSFTRESVSELRSKAGVALAQRYREVERVVLGRAALESLVRSTLATGTGGVVSNEGPPPADVLSALARSGALRLDWAQSAATQVRDVLENRVPQAPARAVAVVQKPKAVTKKRKPAARTATKKKAPARVAAKKKPRVVKAKKKPAPSKKKPAKRK